MVDILSTKMEIRERIGRTMGGRNSKVIRHKNAILGHNQSAIVGQ